jgi:hypothetical protein
MAGLPGRQERGCEVSSLFAGIADTKSGVRLNKAQYENFVRLMNQEKTLLSENAAMREVIREAHGILNRTLRTMSPFDRQRFQEANAALSKLQPFLKP